MSSALKPALTPSGVQNQPVPSQLNKPMHTQGAPTTYGQPMSHIPQNLVNIPHNAPNSGSVHNQVHSINANVHTAHPSNHYSLNVPNASQHYPISGNIPINTHSAPVSNHPVPNTTQAHIQPPSTFSPSPKNLSYNPNYQSNVGHSYKTTSMTPPVNQLPQSQPTETTPPTEKPQSNGTPDIKIASKPEPSQNHVTPIVIEKSIQPPPQLPPAEIQVQSTPEKAKTVLEQASVEPEESVKESNESKPSDEESRPPPEPEDSSTITMAAATADSVPSSVTETSAISTESVPSAETEPPVDSTSTDAMETDRPPSPPSQSTEVPEQIKNDDDNSASPTNATVNKTKDQNNQKPTLKLATTPRNVTKKPKVSKPDPETPKVVKPETKALQKSPGSGGKSKRTRTKTQPYQSPLPEVEMISKITATTPRSRNNEDKLIIFYKNEFLAVRNSEGGFYICQAVQNIYKSSPRIRIRWLSQDKSDKEVYTPDFYDNTDFDCILTNLNLSRAGKGKYRLPAAERIRTDSILKRALAVEKGDEKPTSLTEEHPDGLDLSLYKEESQLKKRKTVKRKASSPLRAAASTSSLTKSPEQAKVQKVAPKPKPPPVKKATVLKKALSTKVKKVIPLTKIARSERTLKRPTEEIKPPIKAVPIIDQKKAKVLAKVARKPVVPAPKPQPPPPPKQIAKNLKAPVPAPPVKKPLVKRPPPVAITRKSKRAKK
ncbi:hypothetical protein PPYR_04423 [Photinus pyralis]|uniref:Uncharacterized protein n=2 Tax=Photinus pyralis TaxID=7054 RepID=A0A1Y1NBP2_PHOPY|nr:titin-like isoform X2 [Photinus pyralis]XP_031334330.1 titin-like isoform X2 [Photinus pyralis]KAB0802237.1 hypothetical protein PPYR_04423 [Photinus pyralis]